MQTPGDVIMTKLLGKFFVVVLLASVLGACAGSEFYHKQMMSGQIVSTDGDQVVLCIGTSGGAENGMTFDVYSVRYDEIGADSDGYKREFAGTISVTEVLDEHFAQATVKSGKVQVNNMVELKN
jgi:hypothetical protein